MVPIIPLFFNQKFSSFLYKKFLYKINIRNLGNITCTHVYLGVFTESWKTSVPTFNICCCCLLLLYLFPHTFLLWKLKLFQEPRWTNKQKNCWPNSKMLVSDDFRHNHNTEKDLPICCLRHINDILWIEVQHPDILFNTQYSNPLNINDTTWNLILSSKP